MKTKMTRVTHISEANLLFRAWRIGDGDIECCMEGREIRDAQFLLLKQRTMWVLETGTVSNPTTHTATITMMCVYSSLYRTVILLLYISQHCWALDSDWSAALTVAQVYINTLTPDGGMYLQMDKNIWCCRKLLDCIVRGIKDIPESDCPAGKSSLEYDLRKDLLPERKHRYVYKIHNYRDTHW